MAAHRGVVYQQLAGNSPALQTGNWLQVSQRVNAGHLPHRGGQERETPAVPSEKGVAYSGSEDDAMRMISARFARVLQRSPL
jgi:hypothetical protein